MRTHKQPDNTFGCHAIDQQFDLFTGTVQIQSLQARIWKSCFTECVEQPQAALGRPMRVRKAKFKTIPYFQIRWKKELRRKSREVPIAEPLVASAIG